MPRDASECRLFNVNVAWLRHRSPATSKPWAEWVLPGLLMCSLGVNVLLCHRLLSSQALVDHLTTLSVGETITPFDARLESGEIRHIGWGGKKLTLIYYFDPLCVWCQRNVEEFRALISHLDKQTEVYSSTANLVGLQEYKRVARHTAVVITDTQQDIRRMLRLNGTPQTIVVDASGRVVKNWEGVYTGSIRNDIENDFHVKLPETLQPLDEAKIH